MFNKISSLEEYIKKVREICEDFGADATIHPWFRGQANSEWPLIPRLYREGKKNTAEREMVRDFMLRGSTFLENTPPNSLEWLFVMQHYGVPTRLLDWTESHLAALFFAVQNEDSSCDGIVWVLHPWILNENIRSDLGRTIPTSSHRALGDYTLIKNSYKRNVEAEVPLAIRPLRNTPRIIAQRGMFTIHGRDPSSLQNHIKVLDLPDKKILQNLVIRQESKSQLKKDLFLAGISYSSLFPDLDGLSREISYMYSDNYYNLNQRMVSEPIN